MRACKIDNNQKEIVKRFRELGCSVLHVHQLKNCCDIFVAYNNVTAAVEIKDGAKPPSARKLSKGEAEFSKNWKGRWFLCESIEDVEAIYQVLKQKQNGGFV